MGRRNLKISLLIVLMPLVLLCGQPLNAQDQLGIGALQIMVDAGYDRFALPVANSALARKWAGASGLAWQVAYNSSFIPVRMDIEHRQARALRGRIEVSTEYGYAAEESAALTTTVVARDFLIPPSVPTSLLLLPRVCPPSVSGGTVTLDFRVYLRDLPQPQFEQRLEVVQLEPAHLYSLYLGQPGSVDRDLINAGNHLALSSPPGMSSKTELFPPEMLQSRHYTIACDRRQVTLAPLAARDFAFVIADLAQVRTWPEDEQDGLLAYLISGGHLCLFNAAGSWHGMDLDLGPGPVGRGNLLPVAGDYQAARRAVTGWLEGELTEFVLWCEGSRDGRQASNLIEMDSLLEQVKNMRKGTPPWCLETGELARRTGYLHPVWIYREACRHSALEPWDYPEFSSAEPRLKINNVNLRRISQPAGTQLQPLPYCTASHRNWPPGLGWLALGLTLALAIGGGFPRHRWIALLAGLLALLAAGHVWWRAVPQVAPPLRIELFDVVPDQSVAVQRELQIAHPDHNGMVELGIAGGAVVRRVTGAAPRPWQLTTGRNGGIWQQENASDFVCVATEAVTAPPESPVSVSTHRIDAATVRLEIDTSGLPHGRECYLLTPLGCLVLPAGSDSISMEIPLPMDLERPGRERIAALEELFELHHSTSQRTTSPQNMHTAQLLNHLMAAPGGNPNPTDAERLCWLGLGQNPTRLRGSTGAQGVILAPLPPAADQASSTVNALRFMRLTFPLGGGR